MKDLYNNIEIATIQAPITVTAHTDDEDIDLVNYNSCVIVATTGANTMDSSNYMSFRLSHADDDGTGSAGSYAYCTGDDLLGAGTVTDGVLATPQINAQGSQFKVGYVGGKRFLKVELRETGSVSCVIGLHIIKGHGLDVPVIS